MLRDYCHVCVPSLAFVVHCCLGLCFFFFDSCFSLPLRICDVSEAAADTSETEAVML